jgi:hypothetical protein
LSNRELIECQDGIGEKEHCAFSINSLEHPLSRW